MANMKTITSTLLKTLVIAGGFLGIFSHSAAAQQEFLGIEVLVNDNPITTYDIEMRLRYVIARSGGVNTEAELLQMREQVIDSMIDEALQVQEAKEEFDYILSDEAMEDYFARQAYAFQMTPEQFEQTLIRIGSSKKAIVDQMRAETVWTDITNGRLGQLLSVSEEEVNAVIKKMKENKGLFEFRLSEIELLVANSSQEESIKAAADRLVKQIREGAVFADVARQLSASPTSASGGSMGWISETDFDDDLRAQLKNMTVGTITAPIRSTAGYQILSLNDRRQILTKDVLDTQLSINQLILTDEDKADEKKAKKFYDAIKNADDYTCDTLTNLAILSGSPESQMQLGFIPARELLASTKIDMTNFQVNDRTDMINVDGADRMFFVCDRREAEVREPDYDAISTSIENQRLQQMSRRWLRDLRRAAIIEKR